MVMSTSTQMFWCQSDGEHALHTIGSLCKATVILIIGQNSGVSVHPHRRVVVQHDGNNDLITDGSQANTAVLVYTNIAGSCSNATEVRILSWMDHKPIQRYECTPQTVSDRDDDDYDYHYRQLTVEAEIELRWGLRRGCERCGV